MQSVFLSFLTCASCVWVVGPVQVVPLCWFSRGRCVLGVLVLHKLLLWRVSCVSGAFVPCKLCPSTFDQGKKNARRIKTGVQFKARPRFLSTHAELMHTSQKHSCGAQSVSLGCKHRRDTVQRKACIFLYKIASSPSIVE